MQPNPDPTSSAVEVEVNGVKYTLEWDFAAVARAEKATGENLLFTAIIFQNLSASKYIGMLWASLQRHHPGISMDEAAKLVSSPASWKKFTDAMIQIWTGAQPDAEPAAANENPSTPAS